MQLAYIPPPQSARLGLHPVARKLLVISHPAVGRRLSCCCLGCTNVINVYCESPVSTRLLRRRRVNGIASSAHSDKSRGVFVHGDTCRWLRRKHGNGWTRREQTEIQREREFVIREHDVSIHRRRHSIVSGCHSVPVFELELGGSTDSFCQCLETSHVKTS